MHSPQRRAGTLPAPPRTSPVNPRSFRKSNTSISDPAIRSISMDRSSRVVSERKSLVSTVSEIQITRSIRISDLESRLEQAQEDLKKYKDQLLYAESSKRKAQQETKEVKKQLLGLAEKHEELQHQLQYLSASDKERMQELCKVSQEWEYKLEVMKKQHAAESAALNEIRRLKTELDVVGDPKAVQTEDVDIVQLDLSKKTLSVIEDLKMKLDQSRAHLTELQGLANKLGATESSEIGETGNSGQEHNNSKAELESELKRTRAHVEKLKAILMENEIKLQSISDQNKKLSREINLAQSTQMQMEVMKDKETKLKILSEENEMLRSEINKRDKESKTSREVFIETTAERELLAKLGYLTMEDGKFTNRAENAKEQLKALTEMEAELKRLKTHSDQWRKAAEAAIDILSSEKNKKFFAESESLDRGNPSTSSFCSEDLNNNSFREKGRRKKLGDLLRMSEK